MKILDRYEHVRGATMIEKSEGTKETNCIYGYFIKYFIWFLCLNRNEIIKQLNASKWNIFMYNVTRYIYVMESECLLFGMF